MKAITIRQPWASLIAAGIKTIETRPRSTSYRGRIAIHAGAFTPPEGEEYGTGWWWCRHMDVGGEIVEQCGMRSHPAPLGAVVASAVLTDCLPIVGPITIGEHDRDERVIQVGADSGRAGLVHRYVGGGEVEADLTDQRPYGDFTPGRWALLLDDIKPTTERCPWCWGADDGFDTPCLKPDHAFDPGCFSCQYSDCPACGGEHTCDPVPARGQQAVPWEWAT